MEARGNEKPFVVVVDAAARVPSGLLSGNVNQLGDFDECLSAPSSEPALRDDEEVNSTA